MIEITKEILRVRDQGHPDAEELKSFMANRLPRPRALEVVRHLLGGCAKCRKVTARVWLISEQGSRKMKVN
jgi:hypothetical protein